MKKPWKILSSTLYVNCCMCSHKNHIFVYVILINIVLKLSSEVELGFSGFSSFSVRVLHIFFFFFELLTSILLFERKNKILYKGFKNAY